MTSSLKGSDFVVVPPEAGEQVGTSEAMAQKFPTNRGYKAGMNTRGGRVNEDGEETSKEHPSTPPSLTVNPPSLHSLRSAAFCLP